MENNEQGSRGMKDRNTGREKRVQERTKEGDRWKERGKVEEGKNRKIQRKQMI